MNQPTIDTKVDPQIVAIRNDIFRLTTHNFHLSKGIYAQPDLDGLIKQVRYFSNFTKDNDPYHEHDFGVINWNGKVVDWKIDYFDTSLTYWCNPMSEDCRRVLTVCLASEY
jgi:hypothetical protein